MNQVDGGNRSGYRGVVNFTNDTLISGASVLFRELYYWEIAPVHI